MISKFANKTAKFVAKRIFTDRVDPSGVFAQSIKALLLKPQEIIVYYGKGGIGKTRLLQQLCASSESIYATLSDYAFHNIFLSFDAREITNEIDVMMSVRNKLHGDGGLYDYALVCYWAKAKLTVDEIKNKYTSLSPNLRKILDDVVDLGCGSITIPAFIVSEAKDLITDEHIKVENREEIEALDTRTDAEIFERLPYYLGLCFSAAAKKGNMHVFFFDSYEAMESVSQTRDWFMEFLASCEWLRACIASRDKLKWGMENAEWDQVLNQHLLQNLSDEDSRWFLEQVPIQDPDIIEKIVLHAGGVPLFLDMSVDLYQDDLNSGRTPDFSKIAQGEKLIDRYMNYLDDDSAYAVRILSVPDSFNTAYALYLLEKQGLSFNEKRLHELFEKSIVVSVDAEMDAWKIDESIRIHLKQQMSEEKVAVILSDMLSYVKAEGNGKAFHYFASALNTVKANPRYLINLNVAIIEQIDYYGNSGFWLELNNLLSACVESENKNLQAIAVMAKNIYIRRTGSLKEGEAFLDAHPLDEDVLSHYYFLYCYQKIQYRHLQGHYNEALEAYQKLLHKMDLIKHLIPAHIYNTVCMKYADLLFLKGQFDDSLRIIEGLLSGDTLSLVDQIEAMRIKGHIFKFQQKYEEASIIYLSALKLIQEKKLDAYLGKLYTNMTEVYAFTNPLESLTWFEKARLVNEKSGNLIELGKAYAAGSIAHACLIKQAEADEAQERVDAALAHGKQALTYAEKAGYRSGEAFALVGLALAHRYGGYIEAYTQTVHRLKDLLSELNVYPYLLALVSNEEAT